MSDIPQQRVGSVTEWMTTSPAERRREVGLLRELRVSVYLVLGLIAVLAVALLLG